MRFVTSTLATLLISIAIACTCAAATPEPAPERPNIDCVSGIPGGVNCNPTKRELKEAREDYARGEKLQREGRLEEAFARYHDASLLAPQDLQYLKARELLKAKLVFDHTDRGNALLNNGKRVEAAAEFRAALELDPENDFARERLEEAVRDPLLHEAAMPVPLANTGEIHLQPKDVRSSFHYRGDVRGLFTQLGSTYGIAVDFDDSVAARQVRFNVEDIDFSTALRLACAVSKSMWSALDAHQLLVAADTAENHRQFDRLSLQTYALPAQSTPQELTEIMTAIRNIFGLTQAGQTALKIQAGQTSSVLEVRAPQPSLEACAKFLSELNSDRPQVMLDIQIFQIDHQLTRNIGLHVPDTFNLYNIPAVALVGLGGQSIQQLINQLISSGGINQANSSSLSGLLAQLGGQGNSIFSQPLATFGGGLTFSGLSLDQLAANLSVNESWVRSLQHMTLRAGQGGDATFHIGERYPILNASYAPIYNSPAIAQVIGNQSYQAPFPSVSYEDLGLNAKIKPEIAEDGTVGMQIELQVRSLTGQSSNGVPVISNQEYHGGINLKDGEPAVVAGQVSLSDIKSLSGIPGLGAIPALNQVMANNTLQQEQDELMIVITPHVLANFARSTPEIWISQ